MILMWSGQLSEIPSGWALCDGQNGRPNLLGRFVMGVRSGSINPGGTGGSNSLTLAQNQIPPHNHDIHIDPRKCTNNLITSAKGEHEHTIYPKSLNSDHRLVMTRDVTAPPSIYLQASVSGSGYSVLWNGTQQDDTHYKTGDFTAAHRLRCIETGKHEHSIRGNVWTPQIDTSTASAGIGAAFDNRPAYYELAYIIKL